MKMWNLKIYQNFGVNYLLMKNLYYFTNKFLQFYNNFLCLFFLKDLLKDG